MKRCDDRHSQFPQECQNVTTGRPTENTEFVLQADDIHIANVEEVRRTQIGRQVLLLNLEANHFRVLVAARNVVDRHGQALALGVRACDGGKQVGRERSNATLAWQVVADESDLTDFRIAFHQGISLLSSGPASINLILRVALQTGNGVDPSSSVAPGNNKLGKVAFLSTSEPSETRLLLRWHRHSRTYPLGIVRALVLWRRAGGAPVRQTQIASRSLP